MTLTHWLVLIPLWALAAVACIYIWRSVAAWKRPPLCDNCGLRPRWAFDFTARGADVLMRDHFKECLS